MQSHFSDKVIYQLYPKSFKDSDGDGMGDLRGAIEKLDYIQSLGVDLIWMNPFYPSPQNDNGYDISDYTAINPDFGTMADFEELVQKADERGMGLMLDFPLNHTSTAHEWFQKALGGDPYYQDFYYIKPPKADGSLPTDWASKFGGPAWEPFGDTGNYYLHLFDVTQADLNWHNPNVREELYQIANFWLEKGIKGMRFDVLNVIGKEEFVDSGAPNSAQEKALYTDTPIVHKWVNELNERTFGRYKDIVTVGEMSSTNVPNGIGYTRPNRNELSMIFSFHHLKVDYKDGNKWTQAPFDIPAFKRIIAEWQQGMTDNEGWNALFMNNHDQPRANSRLTHNPSYNAKVTTMLATTIHLLRGTPYIYQGEEIGMTNPYFDTIDDYRDIESYNAYRELLNQGVDEETAIAIIGDKSRDAGRTPMQWDDSQHAGFTTGTPWIGIPNNYQQINVKNEQENGHIFSYYQKLVQLRKQLPVIQEGDYTELLSDHPTVLAYKRQLESSSLVVYSNFSEEPADIQVADEFLSGYRKLIGNDETNQLQSELTLSPFETIAFIKQ
ncbi:alpha,alpha-phosphotrehalase [Aerococcus suis]|uniref:Trehalose-6-phosphate hydrolase n=1 Tax=Aerococcus suis TaxID=371602 RepID=A0A1W1YTA8_9LACT|nr:alpha,alpha-phosphotrehalase [Aerococcus suis]MCI7240610.1 alpha,alpha-phosphotrehalase [Aerococcus suis]MDY4646518.1 alpha,alpha-phosphotrehalase [Aerococcus suis]SMC39399.1 trehalose-6-phosphate hydrolase [Aerococcus suis]